MYLTYGCIRMELVVRILSYSAVCLLSVAWHLVPIDEPQWATAAAAGLGGPTRIAMGRRRRLGGRWGGGLNRGGDT